MMPEMDENQVVFVKIILPIGAVLVILYLLLTNGFIFNRCSKARPPEWRENIVAAIEQYESEHEMLPANLEALIPDYLTAKQLELPRCVASIQYEVFAAESWQVTVIENSISDELIHTYDGRRWHLHFTWELR